MSLHPKKLHFCFISASFIKASSSPQQIGKSAIALDHSNLHGAKYPIWKALQKLYKGYMGLDPKKLHFCFISVSFDKALLSSLRPLAGEINHNKLGLSKSAIASDSSKLQGAKYPIWKALQKLYKGHMVPNPEKLRICFISVSFDKASSSSLCILLPAKSKQI